MIWTTIQQCPAKPGLLIICIYSVVWISTPRELELALRELELALRELEIALQELELALRELELALHELELYNTEDGLCNLLRELELVYYFLELELVHHIAGAGVSEPYSKSWN